MSQSIAVDHVEILVNPNDLPSWYRQGESDYDAVLFHSLRAWAADNFPVATCNTYLSNVTSAKIFDEDGNEIDTREPDLGTALENVKRLVHWE